MLILFNGDISIVIFKDCAPFFNKKLAASQIFML